MISRKEKCSYLMIVIILICISFNVVYAQDDGNDTFLSNDIIQQDQAIEEIDNST